MSTSCVLLQSSESFWLANQCHSSRASCRGSKLSLRPQRKKKMMMSGHQMGSRELSWLSRCLEIHVVWMSPMKTRSVTARYQKCRASNPSVHSILSSRMAVLVAHPSYSVALSVRLWWCRTQIRTSISSRSLAQLTTQVSPEHISLVLRMPDVSLRSERTPHRKQRQWCEVLGTYGMKIGRIM